jgi:hypothetical protein
MVKKVKIVIPTQIAYYHRQWRRDPCDGPETIHSVEYHGRCNEIIFINRLYTWRYSIPFRGDLW